MTGDRAGEPIAVTVIGGYLGAGKTTLVNEVLRTGDERMAVIVNDFGDINIDAELIEHADDQMLSLTNGCICCSLVDGLAGALTAITELDPRPERLLIEASGVADPAAIAAYGHAPGLLSDAVVVLADAETVRAKSDDVYVGDTITRQLDAADLVVLNKIDLVDAETLKTTREWIGHRWPRAVVVETERGRVPASVLFGVESESHPVDEIGPHRASHHHDADFSSWTVAPAGPVSRAAIERFMEELPPSIVRAKGPVWIDDDPDRRHILQRVGARWTLTPAGPWPGRPATRLVMIGTDPGVRVALPR